MLGVTVWLPCTVGRLHHLYTVRKHFSILVTICVFGLCQWRLLTLSVLEYCVRRDYVSSGSTVPTGLITISEYAPVTLGITAETWSQIFFELLQLDIYAAFLGVGVTYVVYYV